MMTVGQRRHPDQPPEHLAEIALATEADFLAMTIVPLQRNVEWR